MSDESVRLDGNAVAGMMAEIFTFDLTEAQSTCGGCGRTEPLGALLVYGGEMGAVLRCPTCERAEMRIAHIRERYWIDMRGVTALRIAPSLPVMTVTLPS